MEAGYGVVNVDGTDCTNPLVNFHFNPLCPHIAIIIGIDVGNREQEKSRSILFEATPSRLQRPSEPSFFFKPNTEACFCRQEEFLGSQLVERICKGRVINMTKKQIAALRRIIKREQSVYDIAAFPTLQGLDSCLHSLIWAAVTVKARTCRWVPMSPMTADST